MLIALAMRVTVWGPWPVCSVCEKRRRQQRQAMWWSLAAGALALAGSLALPSPGLLLLGVALLAAAIVLRGLSDWYRVTSAVVDKQRQAVRVKSPSAAFRAALSGAGSPGQF